MEEAEQTCCVCGHTLGIHIDEGEGWRCHALAGDGYQCECWLRKGRFADISGYSLGLRMRRHLEDLRREVLE